MDQISKQPNLFGRTSSIDVSQLDKINAIPNKTTDNILMNGLCSDDQFYLNALMDNDSSDTDEEEDNSRLSSTWSPMVQSAVVMNKRIKKLKPSYAVTLSLEDISYIRPSWGISKGVRTIEINKEKKAKAKSEKSVKDEGKTKPAHKERALYYLLVILTATILSVMLTAYVTDRAREESKTQLNKFKIIPEANVFHIFSQSGSLLDPALEVQYGAGVSRSLKGAKCTCSIYAAETQRYHHNHTGEPKKLCLACLDWAYRANLRVFLDDSNNESLCYNIKWQSYDSLLTPIVDCFLLRDEQWFGLGDVQHPTWSLSKMRFNWTLLTTNLSSEFLTNTTSPIDQLPFGSFVDYSLLSTRGIFIGHVKTDFDVSIKIEQDTSSNSRRACISATCTEKCGQTWPRSDEVERLRYKNNFLEYSICSSQSLKAIISKQIERAHITTPQVSATPNVRTSGSSQNNSELPSAATANTDLIERELDSETRGSMKLVPEPSGSNQTNVQETPGGIGLIERTIFATSPEFMPVLDGQTLRQFVDRIVQLGLKTSSILLIDTRWETHVGSLKLNIALFPKSKLLFEILHNKGFKIVFSVKPYIDAGIGMSNINQLLLAGRLYSREDKKEISREGAMNQVLKDYVYRRTSLFTFEKQPISAVNRKESKFPYLFRCKESQEEYCALIDLTQSANRAWLTANIKRSNLLTLDIDGIQLGGATPSNADWVDHYRRGVGELAKTLFHKEKVYTLSQWSGEFGYIQLAPRDCNWDGLRSTINSVLNLGMLGFSLIHPGSVWGDSKSTNSSNPESIKPVNRMDIYGDVQSKKLEEELMVRWLQVSMFLPILQFNNIAPIERYGLQEQLQNLVKIRKLYIVPELKRCLPYTPLIDHNKYQQGSSQLPLIRPVWYNYDNVEYVISEQFLVGSEILVAPILEEGLRQRDIYLPTGFWRDELRQVNLRGGKWLRNYPVELNEIAWFTRAKR